MWLRDERYPAIMDNSDKLLFFSLTLARDGTLLEPNALEVVEFSEHHDLIGSAPDCLRR